MTDFCRKCGGREPDDTGLCQQCSQGPQPLITGAGTISLPERLLNDRYQVLSTVKSGAMGCVYRAMDTRLNKVVAMKKMIKASNDPEEMHYAEQRFAEETRLLSTLRHRGLPTLLDSFCEKDSSSSPIAHYLVMTYIEGSDLETAIKERGQKFFHVEEALGITSQILDILSYLHSQTPPVIYRDLSPRNLMVHQGTVVLVDFGIARVFEPHLKGTAIGTPGYAAPEQYRGAAEPRSDIFSLGVLLHYLLTGTDPESPSIKSFSFETPSTINPEVPEYLDRLIMNMVDIIPDKRPESAQEVMEVLKSHSYRDSRTESPEYRDMLSAEVTRLDDETERNHPALCPCRDIFEAIKKHDFKSVKHLIAGCEDLNRRDTMGYPLIHRCVLEGLGEVVELLIAREVDVNSRAGSNITPLHLAAMKGYRDMVELLLSHGADVNARTNGIMSLLWKTPMDYAKMMGNRDIVEILQKYEHRESRDIS